MSNAPPDGVPADRPEERPAAGGVRQRYEQLYRDLVRIAHLILRRRPAASLWSADLAHAAFLKLDNEELRRLARGVPGFGDEPNHVFKACFGAACRDVLYDHHRKRERRREVHGSVSVEGPGLPPVEFLDLHHALRQLAERDATEAQIVEARVFGDATFDECAALFAMPEATVRRRWNHGIAWLSRRLQSLRDEPFDPQ